MDKYIQDIPARYVGDSPPGGTTATVGGREVVTGGWSDYRFTKREARRQRKNAPESKKYGDKKTVDARDVLMSVFGWKGDPLPAAARRLARAMRAVQSVGGPPGPLVIVPPITASEVAKAGGLTSARELAAMSTNVELLAFGVTKDIRAPPPPKGVPAAPTTEVALENKEELTALEKKVAPRARVLEKYRGEVAEQFDETAAAIEKKLGVELFNDGQHDDSQYDDGDK